MSCFKKHKEVDLFYDNYNNITVRNNVEVEKKLKKNKRIFYEKHCIICFCEYKKNESIKILSCGHVYHENCINKWFLRSYTCPICNTVNLM